MAARQSVERLAPSLATATPPPAGQTSPADPAASATPAPVTPAPATPVPSAPVPAAPAATPQPASPAAADTPPRDLPPVPPRRPQVASAEAAADPQPQTQTPTQTQPQPEQIAARGPTDPPAQAGASGGIETGDGAWRVWLGSAADAAEAQRLAAQLAGSVSALRAEQIETAAGEGRFRLLAGRFSERALAEELCGRLRSEAPAAFCIPIEE